MNAMNPDPTLAVPIAAVTLINKALDLLGGALFMAVDWQEVDGNFEGAPLVFLDWDEGELADFLPDLHDRLEQAVEEVNAALAANTLLWVRRVETPTSRAIELFINI